MTRRAPAMPARLLRSLVTAIIAGLAGLAIHSVLMLAKDAFGILPGFQPLEGFKRLLGAWTGEQLGRLVPYLTGAMFWSFVYARLHARLPGRSFWARGLSFALLAWGVMATGFFLLAGHGLFGLQLGYGLWPAAFMFLMLAVFSLTLSFTHSRPRDGDTWRGNRGSTLRDPNKDEVKE